MFLADEVQVDVVDGKRGPKRSGSNCDPPIVAGVGRQPSTHLTPLTLARRFTFPAEPSEDVIDLTMIEQPRSFYFNPYSGELSLEFPKAEVKCPGGILA